MAVNKHVLRKNLSKSYKYRDLTMRDVTSVINQYKDLKPVIDTYVFNDGSNRELLSLTGTVPVSFKGTIYNIPICLWLLDTYPYNPPICFVKPTSTMMIKTGKHVDANGKIYLPYLHEWKHPESDLFGLIQVMIVIFGEEPPVFARPTTKTAYPEFQAAGPSNDYIAQNSHNIQVKKTSGLQETESMFQTKEGHENREYTVAEIKKLGPGQIVEVVNLKVAHVKPTVAVFVRGVEMDLCKVYGSDQTGSIKVNLWNDAILSVKAGCIYCLTNLETRKKDGKVMVTTTKNTVITEITDMGVVHADYRDEISDEECSLVTIDTRVTGIKIVEMWMCAMCNKQQATFDRTSTFHRCEHCKMKQKTSAFRCASRGTLCLRDGSKACISNTVLSTYLKRENIIHLSLDAEKIEEHFLAVEQFQITMADQCVVDLKPLDSPSCSGAGGLHSAEDPVSQSV